MPAYTIAEAAHYLQIPFPTLRSWVVGRAYPVKAGRKYFQPVIVLPERGSRLLSFVNVVEAHVLDAIRRKYKVPLQKVRIGVSYLQRHFGSKHPLAEEKMKTNGRDLFVRRFGQLINVSQDGQLAILELVDAHLRRIEWDTSGLAVRLYPFTRKRELEEPKSIVMDPYIAFGRPTLVGTGIPTAVIADRCKAGESIEQLADDYGRAPEEILDAIRCELQLAEAA